MTTLFDDADEPALSSATFSPCEQFRYTLTRCWNAEHVGHFHKFLACVGLNPSTADAEKNDPTIRRVIDFAQRLGYSGLVMLNAYAFRSTDPAGLVAAGYPVGEENDASLRTYGAICGAVVAAWGVDVPEARAAAVCELIGREMHCWGKNKGGSPKHPLYLPKAATLQTFWMPPDDEPVAAAVDMSAYFGTRGLPD